jgi:hypothetical protein
MTDQVRWRPLPGKIITGLARILSSARSISPSGSRSSEQWPPSPEVKDPKSTTSPEFEFKKLLYAAQLEVIKKREEVDAEVEKAKQQATTDIDKARKQATIDMYKARKQVAVDIDKARRQVAVDIDKARQDAAIQAEKDRVTANTDREKADWTNEYTQAQGFYTAYIEVAKNQIERAITRAEFVQTAAAAIGGAYTTVLALSFAVDEFALPARGILPTMFLGLSIVLAAAYLAYISLPNKVPEFRSNGTLDSRQRVRRNTFINWAGAPVNPQSYLLQMAVFSLAFGVAFLPAPYIKASNLGTEALTVPVTSEPLIGGTLIWVLAGIAFVLTFVLPFFVTPLVTQLSRRKS